MVFSNFNCAQRNFSLLYNNRTWSFLKISPLQHSNKNWHILSHHLTFEEKISLRDLRSQQANALISTTYPPSELTASSLQKDEETHKRNLQKNPNPKPKPHTNIFYRQTTQQISTTVTAVYNLNLLHPIHFVPYKPDV